MLTNLLPTQGRLTAGERSLLSAYLTVAMFGVAFGMIVVLRLDGEAFFSRNLRLYEYWILASGAAGVCLSLRVCRERFGQKGFWDTLIGMVMITINGSIIAGTLALPIYGTMFGPMTLGIIFWVAPITAILWFASLIGVHNLVRKWSEERDSIFGAPEKITWPNMLRGLWRDLRIR